MKEPVIIIFKSQKFGDVEGYLTFNSNNKTLVDLINNSIVAKIKEYSKDPSMKFDTNYYCDLYLDGSVKTKDGTRCKFYDPELNYSVGDETSSYLKIEISNDKDEIEFNIKVSGKRYFEKLDIMEFIELLKSGSVCNMSAKHTILLDNIVFSLFHLTPSISENYNPWNPPYKQSGWGFGSNMKI